MSANKNMTSFRWEAVDFFKQYSDAKGKDWAYGSFALLTRPSVQFEFFMKGYWYDNKESVWVNLKQFDGGKPVEASVKFWIESTSGQRFGETFVEKQLFGKVGDFCGFHGISSSNSAFWNLYRKHETFFFCCELTDLNERVLPATNHDKEFLKNNWTLYEEKLHDAVIKVGKEEFKVSKFPFMSQSSVFKSMFMSKFKEGITSEIEVKDVEAETMKHLVKWVYTNQIEDDSPIEKLFAASDKYDVKILKETCSENLINTLSDANAFQRLILASMHNNIQLKNAALDFISALPSADFAVFLTSEDWLKFYGKNPGAANEVGKLIREKMCK